MSPTDGRRADSWGDLKRWSEEEANGLVGGFGVSSAHLMVPCEKLCDLVALPSLSCPKENGESVGGTVSDFMSGVHLFPVDHCSLAAISCSSPSRRLALLISRLSSFSDSASRTLASSAGPSVEASGKLR